MQTSCLQCSASFTPVGARGKLPDFCSNACKQKAYRARKKKQYSVFPKEMLARRAWVRADHKRPVMPDGSPASSTNPDTWSPFSDVQSGAGDGFGIMLGEGLGCYDLDDMSDGEVAAFIEAIPEKILFIERSLSGGGVHVFIETIESRGRSRGSVERYSRARFIRTTGNVWR